MESKCYYEKLDLSEEESQKRNCEIHEIINRFKTLESDMSNTTNILEKVRLNTELIKYLESLGPAYELSASATQNIDAQANPSVVALGLVNGLTADQLGKCFENAVNAFNTTLENEFRAYQAFNKLKGEYNVN